MYRTWTTGPLPLRLVLGGLLLVVETCTAIVSILLIIDMLVAMLLVHWDAGFFFTNEPPGIEVNLLFIAGLTSLLLSGAGALSVDRMMRDRPARCGAAHSGACRAPLRRKWIRRAHQALAGVVRCQPRPWC